MGIVTKKGDKGKTRLYAGQKVAKDHPVLEACGTLDELCSFLGFSKSLSPQRSSTKKLLESIQRDLSTICMQVACEAKFINKLKHRVDSGYVVGLEKVIRGLEVKLFDKKKFCFYLPGSNPLSCSLDIARTIARRLERRVVTLKKKEILKNPYILIYLNRLSDLLFLLARYHEKRYRAANSLQKR
jgi:cob(I)alamin adenosyltransferase